MMISSKNRSDLIPEGLYRADVRVRPIWLRGRLLYIWHREHEGYWFAFARVRQRGRIVDVGLQSMGGKLPGVLIRAGRMHGGGEE